jgi:hypothetical protein
MRMRTRGTTGFIATGLLIGLALAAASIAEAAPALPPISRVFSDLLGIPPGQAKVLSADITARAGTPAVASLWRMQPFTLGTTERLAVFVTEKQVGANCHACGVVLDAAVYRVDAQAWVLESKELSVAEIGAFGDPPDVEGIDVLALAPAAAGFVMQTSDIGTGVEETSARVVVYRSDDAHWVDAGLISLGANNSPSCSVEAGKPEDAGSTPCWGYMGELSMATTSDGGLKDLKVARRGTDQAGHPVRDGSFEFDTATQAYIER